MSSSQGHDFRLWYKHEDNGFNQDPADDDPKPFGYNAQGDQFEGSNQAVQVFEPNSRVPADIVRRLFDGAWAVSFVYTNPWWLNSIYGTPSTTDNGDGSHTHTWDGEDIEPQRIGIGRDDAGKERVLQGCVATQAQIQPSVNDMARVTIRGAYAEETINDPASLEDQPSVNHEAMTFIEAQLQRDGSTIGLVQDGTLEFANNVELIPEWGSRVPVDFSERTLVPQMNFTKIVEGGSTDNIAAMYGDRAAATSVQNDVATAPLTFTLDNDTTAGSGINVLTANMSGSFPNSVSENGIGDPETDVTHEINRLTETVTMTATNEVATAR